MARPLSQPFVRCSHCNNPHPHWFETSQQDCVAAAELVQQDQDASAARVYERVTLVQVMAGCSRADAIHAMLMVSSHHEDQPSP